MLLQFNGRDVLVYFLYSPQPTQPVSPGLCSKVAKPNGLFYAIVISYSLVAAQHQLLIAA
jgi:hypothetical protein